MFELKPVVEFPSRLASRTRHSGQWQRTSIKHSTNIYIHIDNEREPVITYLNNNEKLLIDRAATTYSPTFGAAYSDQKSKMQNILTEHQ